MLVKCSTVGCSIQVFGGGLCADCERAPASTATTPPQPEAARRNALHKRMIGAAILRKVGPGHPAELVLATAPREPALHAERGLA